MKFDRERKGRFARVLQGLVILAAAWSALAQQQTAGASAAQEPVADRKFAEWAAQSAALEPRLRSLRACDAQVKETISEVANASSAWMDGWQRIVEARFQAAGSAGE